MLVTFALLGTHGMINIVLLLCYRGHTDAVLCVQFDKEKVVSGSKDTTIKVLRAAISRLLLHENVRYERIQNTSGLFMFHMLRYGHFQMVIVS